MSPFSVNRPDGLERMAHFMRARPLMARAPSIAGSLREYGRGLAGGLLFSLPLIYTMEVWWTGLIARPERLLVYFASIFVLLLGYNRYAGMRHDASWVEVLVDSVEELGLGIVTAAFVLYLLGRISPTMSFDEILGKIIIEAGIVAIGFSIGTAQLGGDADKKEAGMTGSRREAASFVGQMVIALCGAVLFAANVAPTEEIIMIAVETSHARLLGLAAFSIAIGTLILFFSSFRQSTRVSSAGSHLDVIAGSAVTYAIALVASAGILWFFGRFDGCALDICVRETVVLALPGVLGASAGRLLLQT
jgi:putative integral membrane protein (TIGR02587 family)